MEVNKRRAQQEATCEKGLPRANVNELLDVCEDRIPDDRPVHQPLQRYINDPEARHVVGRDRGRLPFRHSPPACKMNRPASGAHLP